MPGYFGRVESLHRIHSWMWINKSCASLLLFCLCDLFCFLTGFGALLQGSCSSCDWQLFFLETCILIRAGESCMLSRGHSAQKTCFQEDGGEEY